MEYGRALTLRKILCIFCSSFSFFLTSIYVSKIEYQFVFIFLNSFWILQTFYKQRPRFQRLRRNMHLTVPHFRLNTVLYKKNKKKQPIVARQRLAVFGWRQSLQLLWGERARPDCSWISVLIELFWVRPLFQYSTNGEQTYLLQSFESTCCRASESRLFK